MALPGDKPTSSPTLIFTGTTVIRVGSFEGLKEIEETQLPLDKWAPLRKDLMDRSPVGD